MRGFSSFITMMTYKLSLSSPFPRPLKLFNKIRSKKKRENNIYRLINQFKLLTWCDYINRFESSSYIFLYILCSFSVFFSYNVWLYVTPNNFNRNLTALDHLWNTNNMMRYWCFKPNSHYFPFSLDYLEILHLKYSFSTINMRFYSHTQSYP